MEGVESSSQERNVHGGIVLESLREMRNNKEMLDATIACDDAKIDVHKLVLAACSSFFREVISDNCVSHTYICLAGVKSSLLSPLVNFMYMGEVFIAPEDLSEFLDLAKNLQVYGLMLISPGDGVTPALSSSFCVEISKSNLQGEGLPQNKVKEVTEVDEDVNRNVVEVVQYRKENIYVEEIAILFNTIDKDVSNHQDENDNGTNIKIEVTEIVENGKEYSDAPDNYVDGKGEGDPLYLDDDKISSKNIIEECFKTEKFKHQIEDNGASNNQTDNLKEKEHSKDKNSAEFATVAGPEERNGTTERHRLICSKIAKVGVGELRRHICKDCGKTGSKDIIYNHIADEHCIKTDFKDTSNDHIDDEQINLNIQNEKEENLIIDCDNQCSGSDKIVLHGVDENTLHLDSEMPMSASRELQASFTKVGKLDSSEEKLKGSFSEEIIVESKKRKVVTFSPNGPEEFIYEREDKSYFKKKRFAHSEAEVSDAVSTETEGEVDANKDTKVSVDVDTKKKLLSVGILSVTKQGFVVQDKPQEIEDLDKIQQKPVRKKIVTLAKNKVKCMERKVKRGRF